MISRVALILLFVFTLRAAPAQTPANSAADIAAQRAAGHQIQLQLDQALAQHAARFVIPPGTYRLTPEIPDHAHIVLKQAANFDLVANGVTILCETKNTALALWQCHNVTIEGLTIDYDPLPMTQGTITAITPGGFDFKIDDGYSPLQYDGKGVGHIWVADAKTRLIKPGSANYGTDPKNIIHIGDNLYHFTRKSSFYGIAPGDHIKFPQKLNLKSPHAVNLFNCQSVTFQNVTIESAPCFGFVSTWGDGLVLDHVRVVPGPPPPGATEPRIFSSSADGINLENDRRGPIVRNCTVQSNGDDGIAVYNQPDTVLAQQPDGTIQIGTVWGDPRVEPYNPGDMLRFFLKTSGRIVEAKVTEVKPGPTGPALKPILDALQLPPQAFFRSILVRLDAPVTTALDDRVLNTQFTGRGFQITGNTLINDASRGITLNYSYGDVSQNHIEHSYLPAIHMTEFMKDAGNGSAFQTSVKIENNTITDPCIAYTVNPGWNAAISLIASGPFAHSLDGYSNIAITGNSIDRLNGPGIYVTSATNVSIENNTFGDLERVGAAKIGAPAIQLSRVNGAAIHNNILAGSGWEQPDSELSISSDCFNVSLENGLIK